MVDSASVGRYCLFVLVFQNLLYTLCMRHARSRSAELFFPSSMMLVSEAVKMFICIIVISTTNEMRSSISSGQSRFHDTLKTCVPAFIYLIQNRLLVSALENLDAATFQVAYQLKLLTTALFSVIILRKSITIVQWFALLLLFMGVSMVEPPTSTDSSKALNPSLGLFYVVCAAILSGFASVYFELLLKSSSKSLWMRNLELAGVSLITGIIAQIYSERNLIQQKGFFYGFDYLVWIVILLHSVGGLVVAMVVKYANNMLKGFACSISIVLSCLYSVMFLGVQLNTGFLLGTICVLISVFLYSMYPPVKSESARD